MRVDVRDQLPPIVVHVLDWISCQGFLVLLVPFPTNLQHGRRGFEAPVIVVVFEKAESLAFTHLGGASLSELLRIRFLKGSDSNGKKRYCKLHL